MLLASSTRQKSGRSCCRIIAKKLGKRKENRSSFIFACLYSIDEIYLRMPFRNDASECDMSKAIRNAVFLKEPGHFINIDKYVKPERSTHSIGG